MALTEQPNPMEHGALTQKLNMGIVARMEIDKENLKQALIAKLSKLLLDSH